MEVQIARPTFSSNQCRSADHGKQVTVSAALVVGRRPLSVYHMSSQWRDTLYSHMASFPSPALKQSTNIHIYHMHNKSTTF